MLRKFLARIEWSEIADFLSPGIFGVLLLITLKLKTLATNFVNRRDFGEVAAGLACLYEHLEFLDTAFTLNAACFAAQDACKLRQHA
jgi:hypothetical protein